LAQSNIADRNLLFGMLALQMDFITRDELVGAMQEWVFEKTTALGDLLVRRGKLAPARRELLEAVVDEHLRTHGGNVRESLASVGRLAVPGPHAAGACGGASTSRHPSADASGEMCRGLEQKRGKRAGVT
jgi:hypothetical protein